MARHRFFKGMRFESNGREHLIQDRLTDGQLVVRDLLTGQLSQVTDADLLQGWVQGEFRFLGHDSFSVADRNRMKGFVDDITALPDDEPRKAVMRRRYAYVRALIGVNSPSDVKRLVSEVHTELREPCRSPNWKTVYYGWFKAYVDSGEDIRALLPDFKKRGNRKPKFCGQPTKGFKYSPQQLEIAEELAIIVDQVIRERYLTTDRLTVDAVYDALLVRIDEENITRRGREFPLPSRRAIYQRVSKLDKYEVAKGRLGKRYADKMFHPYGASIQPTRPLQRVEVDSTTLNLMVVDDETGLPWGRPTFTTAIDAFTKMILGFYFSFDGEGALALLQCLLHAIQPKTYVRTEYPEVLGAWDAYGIPELVVVDNGPGQHSKAFEDSSNQLGFVIQYCPVKKPWFKGTVERYFESQDSELVHGIPGTTFSDIFSRAEYDPVEQAIVSFKTLLLLYHKFIVDVYQNRVHRGINDIPSRRWRESITKHPPALPAHVDELKVLLGHIELRTLQHYGIELFNIRYNGDAVARLRRFHRTGMKFKLKYDPSDLNGIWVLDPTNDKFLPVPSVHPEYTAGLRLYNHRVIQQYLRKRNRNLTNPVELARAREEIHHIVQRDWASLKKIGPRKRMGRWLGIAQPEFSNANTAHGTASAIAKSLRLTPPASHVSGASEVVPPVPPTTQYVGQRRDGLRDDLPKPETYSSIVPDSNDDCIDLTGWDSTNIPRKK